VFYAYKPSRNALKFYSLGPFNGIIIKGAQVREKLNGHISDKYVLMIKGRTILPEVFIQSTKITFGRQYYKDI